MNKRDHLREITQRKKRNAQSLRISAFTERHDAIVEAFKRLLTQADPIGTTFDNELCRYFPIALVAAIEGYFRQAVADLANAGEPYRSRTETAVKRLPKPNISAAVATGEITLGDWYSHVTSFGSLHDIDQVLSEILSFPFLDRLLTSEFEGVFETDGEAFHLRDIQEDVVNAAVEIFQMRHMLCHEFAPEIQPDIASVLRMLTVADLLVAVSEVIIFAETKH